MQTTPYGIRTVLPVGYDEALSRARTALASEGFGVLCEIDIQAKLKEKLGVDTPRYVILGACNPPLAHEALQQEADLGLLLPCNVIVYEESAGHSVVAAIEAESMMTVTGNDKLKPIAHQVATKLKRVMAAVEGRAN
ncbi:MAG TPA: DUF302 domain-containing protein [Thermoanaerobaculia bacterium]|nr:DUF302 domain-containing protein [Thermoanaerobaculia bacterium]